MLAGVVAGWLLSLLGGAFVSYSFMVGRIWSYMTWKVPGEWFPLGPLRLRAVMTVDGGVRRRLHDPWSIRRGPWSEIWPRSAWQQKAGQLQHTGMRPNSAVPRRRSPRRRQTCSRSWSGFIQAVGPALPAAVVGNNPVVRQAPVAVCTTRAGRGSPWVSGLKK